MKFRSLSAITLLLATLLTSCQTQVLTTTESNTAVQSTHTLVKDNLYTVLNTGKPVLAEFGRATCDPCKQMKPILEQLAVDYESNLDVVIISVDDYPTLTAQSQIMALPTQIFFDSSGKEIMRHIGFYSRADIMNQLKLIGIK